MERILELKVSKCTKRDIQMDELLQKHATIDTDGKKQEGRETRGRK